MAGVHGDWHTDPDVLPAWSYWSDEAQVIRFLFLYSRTRYNKASLWSVLISEYFVLLRMRSFS
jgi:hypothetical protein